MAHKTLIGGTAYEITGGKTLVDGTAYSIKNGKALVDGTVYEVGFGKPIGELEIGSSVFLNVNGVSTEFLVVHQGLPGSLYDSSCSGTWLLMKDCYTKMALGTSANEEYSNLLVHTYLNDTFLNLFDSNIKSVIKQVKIPHTTGSKTSVASGSNGLSAKCFLLSLIETGITESRANTEGVKLDYFVDASDRIANFGGSASKWWTRSVSNQWGFGYNWMISDSGSASFSAITNSQGVRPALILPSDTVL